MTIGRNDPCYCGSGKKYKNCCINKMNQKQSSVSTSSNNEIKVVKDEMPVRKLKAKVISAGGKHASEPATGTQQPVFDYNYLMERAFGPIVNSDAEFPPLPEDPYCYMINKEKSS